MTEEEMTPRERWISVLKRRKSDHVPTDYWATDEVTANLMRHIKCRSLKEMYERLHIDAVKTVRPRYMGPTIPEDADIYGSRYRNVKYGTGVYRECIYHPLAAFRTAGEIKKNFVWPSIDLFDYSIIPDQIVGFEDYPIRGGGSEPFLIYKNLRGQRQGLLDLYQHPDIVHYCLDNLFDFCYENTRLIYKQIPGKVMLSYVAEDLGAQNGLLFSPKHIHEFLIPRMKRMIDLAHHNGVYAFFHSDGSIKKIIPDMIETGIDIVNPIQWRCKDMDREELKRDFGDRVVFHGAMDNQQTLPFGSEQEVRQEVRDNLNILGRNGGYILAPCHNLQPVTPVRNIVAMYDEAHGQCLVN
jgi:uroporphyrinogen decarboxylase